MNIGLPSVMTYFVYNYLRLRRSTLMANNACNGLWQLTKRKINYDKDFSIKSILINCEVEHLLEGGLLFFSLII